MTNRPPGRSAAGDAGEHRLDRVDVLDRQHARAPRRSGRRARNVELARVADVVRDVRRPALACGADELGSAASTPVTSRPALAQQPAQHALPAGDVEDALARLQRQQPERRRAGRPAVVLAAPRRRRARRTTRRRRPSPSRGPADGDAAPAAGRFGPRWPPPPWGLGFRLPDCFIPRLERRASRPPSIAPGVLRDQGATGRRTRRPVLFGDPPTQVSEYRDLWHPKLRIAFCE